MIAYICLAVFIMWIAVFVSTIKDLIYNAVPLTPKAIFEESDLNFPNAVFLWMVMFLLNPIFFIASFLRWVLF